MHWPYDPEHPVTKVCAKCSEEKHLMEFYLDYGKGRRLCQCKECMRAYQRAYYASNIARCRALAAARARRYEKRYPQREVVRSVSRGLVELGLIEVGDRCVDCGGGPVVLHHPDYDDVYNVVPLCRRCHSRRHFADRRRTGGGRVK